MFAKPRVFISYPRRDGEEFANRLRQRLEKEQPEITLWQDRARMEGGIGWWQQITNAIDAVEFMVLVMTPEAVKSETVRKEWRYARQQGVCVYPVKGAPDAALDFGALPRWMSKVHFFDLDREWDTFVQYLKSPPPANRVPFMAPDLPEGFVERPDEFSQLLGHLLDSTRQNPVAITSALHGAGGFGKSTLAAALCHHDDIITAFVDGILWLTLGDKPKLLEKMTELYAALTGTRPPFVNQEDAIVELCRKLEDKNCLLVIDDVWNPAHLWPFLRGGKGCARLVTTRQFEVAAEAKRVNVDEMTTDQAVQMLIAGLQPQPTTLKPFQLLAQRLGKWPQMLELARGPLRQRIARGDSLTGALDYLNLALDRKGVTAFDRKDPQERRQAIGRTIEVSLELLSQTEQQRYAELAIFPDDLYLSLTALNALWSLDDFETQDLVLRLDNLSLLQFDLKAGTIHLHDVMRAYLAAKLSAPAIVHARLVDAWGDPYHLPHIFAWRWLTYHLAKAGRKDDLRSLLFDFHWLQAKLNATDVTALIADFQYLIEDSDMRLLQGAIRLAAHILARDKTQLAGQLWGRLQAQSSVGIRSMLLGINQPSPWIRPLTCSLVVPGGPLLRTLQAQSEVTTAAVSADGQRAVSGSTDGTLTIWDLDSGSELRSFTGGHVTRITALAVSPNGRFAASGSTDDVVRIWDLNTGAELHTLTGHSGWVTAIVITPDCHRLISGSADNTLKVWDFETGKAQRTFEGHTLPVTAVAVTSDGRCAISASWDEVLHVWDLESGVRLRTLRGHTAEVTTVAMDADSGRIVSGSTDKTLRVWDFASGAQLLTLSGHTYPVTAVAVTPHKRRVISGSADKTIRIWDLDTGSELRTLRGHASSITAIAVIAEGRQVISGSLDLTLKVWDLETEVETLTQGRHTSRVSALTVTPSGTHTISCSADETLKIWDADCANEPQTLTGHVLGVISVAVLPDGHHLVSGSADKTVKLWDLDSRTEICTFSGHTDSVDAVAVTPDGRYIISGSADRTLKIWDLECRSEVCTLYGHRDSIDAIAVAPDGRYVMSGSADKTVKVWELESRSEVCTLSGHTDSVDAVAVTPDGNYAISGSLDRTIKVWDLLTRTEYYTLQGHSSSVTAIAVAPSGTRAISASLDHTLKLWDLESRRLMATFSADGGVYSCVVQPDGATIVVGDVLGRLHLLRIEEQGVRDNSV